MLLAVINKKVSSVKKCLVASYITFLSTRTQKSTVQLSVTVTLLYLPEEIYSLTRRYTFLERSILYIVRKIISTLSAYAVEDLNCLSALLLQYPFKCVLSLCVANSKFLTCCHNGNFNYKILLYRAIFK